MINNQFLSDLKDAIEARMKLNEDDAVLRDIVADARRGNPAQFGPVSTSSGEGFISAEEYNRRLLKKHSGLPAWVWDEDEAKEPKG
jgi:hypothetical protein